MSFSCLSPPSNSLNNVKNKETFMNIDTSKKSTKHRNSKGMFLYCQGFLN